MSFGGRSEVRGFVEFCELKKRVEKIVSKKIK
jgi:hypothetical protein